MQNSEVGNILNSVFLIFIAILSLFAFFKLAKVKASGKQLNRKNRINRFGDNKRDNIIEGESIEVDDEKRNSE